MPRICCDRAVLVAVWKYKKHYYQKFNVYLSKEIRTITNYCIGYVHLKQKVKIKVNKCFGRQIIQVITTVRFWNDVLTCNSSFA